MLCFFFYDLLRKQFLKTCQFTPLPRPFMWKYEQLKGAWEEWKYGQAG